MKTKSPNELFTSDGTSLDQVLSVEELAQIDLLETIEEDTDMARSEVDSG